MLRHTAFIQHSHGLECGFQMGKGILVGAGERVKMDTAGQGTNGLGVGIPHALNELLHIISAG